MSRANKVAAIRYNRKSKQKVAGLSVNFSISPDMWVDLRRSWIPCTGRHKTKYLRRGGDCMSTSDSYALFNFLGGVVPKNKKIFSKILIDFLSRQEPSYKLRVASIVYAKSANPNEAPRLLNIGYDAWREAFSLMDYEVCPWGGRRFLKIIRGSFFLDGRWIHFDHQETDSIGRYTQNKAMV